MTTRAAEALEVLRTTITTAKAVPMSASCMVNRAETLALIDTIAARIKEETAASQSVEAEREQQLDNARQQAAQIIETAGKLAEEMVAETPIHTEAVAKAEEVTQEAANEAEEIRREADSYVDGRMAALEAALARSMSQIQAMRTKLAERSQLDERVLQDAAE
ncbi:MAG: hypothetical protein ACK5LN_08415 [Propioniciclava sp.]